MLINVHGNITFFFFFLTCTQTLQIWERHQPGDMTVSEQGSPDTEVGVDLAQAIQQPADGEEGRNPTWEFFLLHNPLAKESRV